jgi:hypothetical protein
VFKQVVADQQTVCFQALNRAAQINRIPKNDRGHYERETTGPITTMRRVRRVRRSVYCTASFSVCSRCRTELPIIYADFRLDYKLATLREKQL